MQSDDDRLRELGRCSNLRTKQPQQALHVTVEMGSSIFLKENYIASYKLRLLYPSAGCRLNEHLHMNNILVQEQFGFRKDM
jgi:hypothetical protein